MRPTLLRCLAAAVIAVLSGCNEGNNWTLNDSGPGDADGVTGCTDGDGDGHGPGCPAGPDCDDTDPFHSSDCPACLAGPTEGCVCDASDPIACYDGPDGTIDVGACRSGSRRCVDGLWTACEGQVTPDVGERCNDLDDDCDGEVDEGVAGECGDCDPSCTSDSLGRDGEGAWEPGEDNSEAVTVDAELGGLVLDSASINTFTIWVANSAEGTVSKVDVRTYAEIGRFSVGTDPSRTSVNTLGDVYVGLRSGYGVAKISTLGDRCPDTNGDGVITTSTDHTVLPFGQDDCVLWVKALPGGGLIRGVAAQDVYGPDGEVRPYVWVGGYNGYLWKLDGETGEILVNATPAPTVVYGLALDGHGNLWASGNGSSAIGRVDTNRCIDDASCAAAPCAGEGVGDECVKQSISYPIGNPYGITVDNRQRVWGAGSAVHGGPCRYDPALPAGSRWACAGINSGLGGVAADSAGFVWAAGGGWAWPGSRLEVFRIDAEDPTQWTAVAGASGWGNHGMAVDAEGKVWAINYTNNNATVITPGPTLHEATVETGVAPFFSSPYTYSDMTGSQLRFATRPRGWYRALFVGCDDTDTEWGDLDVDMYVPEGTSVLIRARSADDPAALNDAAWVVLATVPDDALPISIVEAFTRDAVTPGAYLEVELQLASEVPDGSERLTPVVYSLSLAHRCPSIVG
jgi:hypothetical protein